MTTLDNVNAGLKIVSDTVNTLAPFIEAAVPAAIPFIAIGQKIVQGYLAAEPKAVALYGQIAAGTPLTVDQVQQYMATFDADDDKLAADIQAALDKLPPG